MYRWTDEMIRFMEDASAYGNYHRELAELILPHFSGEEHICDAGCGLGELSLVLADRFRRITAVDIKPRAVRVLEKHCKEQGIRNIFPIAGDIHALPPAVPYDGMVFCFFGRSEEILDIVREQCSGTAVVIKKDYHTHRFSRGEYPTGPDGFDRMKALLTERKIPFRAQQASLEFGQPFRCFEDVRTFFRVYSRDEDPAVLTDDFLRSKVVGTGRSGFPLYMPHQRRLGIISFRSGDIQ